VKRRGTSLGLNETSNEVEADSLRAVAEDALAALDE